MMTRSAWEGPPRGGLPERWTLSIRCGQAIAFPARSSSTGLGWIFTRQGEALSARRARRASRRDGPQQWLVCAALVVVVASCSSGGAPRKSPSTPIRPSTGSPSTSAPVVTPVPAPANCHLWSCRLRQTVTLPDQYAVRLWLGSDPPNSESRPVVELLDQ